MIFNKRTIFNNWKIFKGDCIGNEKRRTVLVLWGYHPDEDYSRDVALALAESKPENVVVREFVLRQRPRQINWGRLLKENKSHWALDLHSENKYDLTHPDEIDLKSSSLGTIGWGWTHNYDDLMKNFFKEYYNGKEILSHGLHDSTNRLNMHSRCFGLGLLYYRPFQQSLELVSYLTDYLKRVPC